MELTENKQHSKISHSYYITEDYQPQRDTPDTTEWKKWQLFLFRVAFIFFALFTVSFFFTPDYYKGLLELDWANLHIRDLGKFSPRGIRFMTIDSESGRFGIASYVNWGISLIIALVGATIWTLIDKKSKSHPILSYFIQVAVRFTIIMQLTGLTFSKIFPSQMPPLSVGQLNNNFGDFTAQKMYWTQLSFTPQYETVLGFAELAIMVLLFFRRTTALGAALCLAMVGNIAISNHVYDGEVHLLASFHALGGAFLLAFYLPKIWDLIVREKDVVLNLYHFNFKETWQKSLRIALKTAAFGIFFLLSAYLHYDNYKNDSYKVPSLPGLKNARGYYDVTEFRVNNKVIPYSPVDSVRWQYATFENWSTLGFKVHRKFDINTVAGRGKQFLDVDRTYESAGTGGGKVYYYYESDTVNQLIYLKNKNKFYEKDSLVLHYERPTENRIILSGLNEFKDSIHVVLDRKDKEYLIFHDRLTNNNIPVE
jgi:hypothetical protein